MDIQKEEDYARKGFELWETLNGEYKLTNYDCVVCFPTTHKNLNEIALSHVNRFTKGKYYKRAVILLRCGTQELYDIEDDDIVIEKKYLNEEEMISLIYYFRLMNICKNVIIVSAEEPFGNLNMIGKFGIDYEDYVSGTYI